MNWPSDGTHSRRAVCSVVRTAPRVLPCVDSDPGCRPRHLESGPLSQRRRSPFLVGVQNEPPGTHDESLTRITLYRKGGKRPLFRIDAGAGKSRTNRDLEEVPTRVGPAANSFMISVSSMPMEIRYVVSDVGSHIASALTARGMGRTDHTRHARSDSSFRLN